MRAHKRNPRHFEDDPFAAVSDPTSSPASRGPQSPVARLTSDFVASAKSEEIELTRFTFTRCIRFNKAEIIRASSSSAACRALLEHFAAIAKPHDGAPVLLLLFARLATMACDWLDGDLFITMDARTPWITIVTIATELGDG